MFFEPTRVTPETSSSSRLKNADYSSSCNELELAEKEIIQYLSSKEKSDDAKQNGVGNFHLHGWRWHNMSLIREAERLRRLAQQCAAQKTSSLSSLDENHIANVKKAIDYVVNFNLKGFTRVEHEVLIPFFRQQFDEHSDVKKSMKTVMDQLEKEEENLSRLGSQLSSKIPSTAATDAAACQNVMDIDDVMEDIVRMSNEIIDVAKSMLERKNNVIIPAITHLVPERQQKSTTNKIMSTHGIFNLRCHLVGFHEAIKNDEEELRQWNENIPLVARKALPMWKRNQYDPQTSALQGV